MTMGLSDGGMFLSYLRCLTSGQLEKLTTWQDTRLSDSPSKDIVLDATSKKRLIYLEQKRRRK